MTFLFRLGKTAKPEKALAGNPDSNYKTKKGLQMREAEQMYAEAVTTNGGKLEIMKHSAGSAQYLSERLKTLGAESTRRRVKDGWIVSCHVPTFQPTPEDRIMNDENTPIANEPTEPAPIPDHPPVSEEIIEWQRTTLTDEEADVAMRAAAAKRKPSNRRRA